MEERDKFFMEYIGATLGRYDKPLIRHFKAKKVAKKVKKVVKKPYVKPTVKAWFGHVKFEVCDKPQKVIRGEFVIGAMSTE